ncbi:MAG: UDP-glucose 4-epimerase GalE [Xylanivirga thermophila]|jgi:UDP-glucose 4-epimerase|uniref:UDP-glucose 4-epimerase GalE n=1 Tax=Xylanivirga thermophila TaxID=2496273 RepID=UPI00101B8D3D|nr:UDP-glucose 4-epimerase GalE [Xylanivirga thermophila]
MAILVTGGAGYIGSHTVKELKDRGREVVVYDNLSRGHRDAVGEVPLIVADLMDSKVLAKTIEDYNIDSVVHFAAESQVGESMQNPQKYYLNNVSGTLNLLKVMLDKDVKNIVFSSTAATYGEPEEVPITENCPKNPTNVYGRTKLMIEHILSDYDRAYGLKYVALRYFNAAGAHISGEIGEDHAPETHLIPIIMEVLLGKRDKLSIFGTDYATEDGTCIRDYIHVTDLAQAHILALDWLKSGNPSRAYNLGNGNGFSVKQVVDTVERVTGREIPVEYAKRRAGDPAVLIASSQKVRDELKWQPQFDDLDTIISTAWKWHSNHPNGYEGR